MWQYHKSITGHTGSGLILPLSKVKMCLKKLVYLHNLQSRLYFKKRETSKTTREVKYCADNDQYIYFFCPDATPRILGSRNEYIKVTEGSQALLDCRFFGSPVPELRWWEHAGKYFTAWKKLHECFFCRSKYGQGNLEGNRFKTHSNGTLEIKNIQLVDQGTYLCVVSNVAGRDENQVRIEVKGEGHIF